MIPRIIHQTWKTESLPPRFAESRASWQRAHPDWEYRFWTDADIDAFVRAEFPELTGLFAAYQQPIQRVDAFRYLVLYRQGGIYADLDIECLLSFEPFRAPGLFLAPTEPLGYSNDLMGAEAGHPFFRHVIDRLPAAHRRWQHWYVMPHLRVLATTGSLFLTGCVRSWRGARPIVDLSRRAYGTDPQGEGPVHVVHRAGGTWHRADSRFLARVFARRRVLGPSVLALAAMALAFWLVARG